MGLTYAGEGGVRHIERARPAAKASACRTATCAALVATLVDFSTPLITPLVIRSFDSAKLTALYGRNGKTIRGNETDRFELI